MGGGTSGCRAPRRVERADKGSGGGQSLCDLRRNEQSVRVKEGGVGGLSWNTSRYSSSDAAQGASYPRFNFGLCMGARINRHATPTHPPTSRTHPPRHRRSFTPAPTIHPPIAIGFPDLQPVWPPTHPDAIRKQRRFRKEFSTKSMMPYKNFAFPSNQTQACLTLITSYRKTQLKLAAGPFFVKKSEKIEKQIIKRIEKMKNKNIYF